MLSHRRPFLKHTSLDSVQKPPFMKNVYRTIGGRTKNYHIFLAKLPVYLLVTEKIKCYVLIDLSQAFPVTNVA